MKNKNEDAFWQKVELYLAFAFPREPEPALTREQLAQKIGVDRNWITRNVPRYLFIGNRIHWSEYCRWRMKEQDRLANEADGSRHIVPETEADRRWQEIKDSFHGRRNSTRDARK